MEMQFDKDGDMVRYASSYWNSRPEEMQEVVMFVDKLKYVCVKTTSNGYAYFILLSVTDNKKYYVMRSDFNKFMRETLQPDGTFVGVFGWRKSGRTQGIYVAGKIIMKLASGV